MASIFRKALLPTASDIVYRGATAGAGKIVLVRSRRCSSAGCSHALTCIAFSSFRLYLNTAVAVVLIACCRFSTNAVAAAVSALRFIQSNHFSYAFRVPVCLRNREISTFCNHPLDEGASPISFLFPLLPAVLFSSLFLQESILHTLKLKFLI